jgi:hypothetical protein
MCDVTNRTPLRYPGRGGSCAITFLVFVFNVSHHLLVGLSTPYEGFMAGPLIHDDSREKATNTTAEPIPLEARVAIFRSFRHDHQRIP